MALIGKPAPNRDRERMTIKEQFHAVYTVLQEHHPELAKSYAANYPEYTKPFPREQVLVEATAQEPKPIIEAHNEFSRQLVEVIKSLIEEQRESYKDHIKGQRDMFERSDFTTANSHREIVEQLRNEVTRLRKKGHPWLAAAIISWVVTLTTAGTALFFYLTQLQ
jgi:hypothetical protein